MYLCMIANQYRSANTKVTNTYGNKKDWRVTTNLICKEAPDTVPGNYLYFIGNGFKIVNRHPNSLNVLRNPFLSDHNTNLFALILLPFIPYQLLNNRIQKKFFS